MVRELAASFLAEVLLLSAAYKFRSPSRYRHALSSYTSLGRKPTFGHIASRLIWGLPVLEMVVAVSLLIRPLQLPGTAAATLLFGTFYFLLGRDDRSRIANCGCWGSNTVSVPRHLYLLRNLVFLLCSAGLLSWQLASASQAPSDLLVLSLESIALAFPFSLFALELPQIAEVISLKPRTHSIERPQ